MSDAGESAVEHPGARDADQLAWAVWTDDGRSRECYAVLGESEAEARENAVERHGAKLENALIDGPYQNAEPGVWKFEYVTEHRETVVVEAPHEDYASESADAERNYSGEFVETIHTESRRLDVEVNPDA